MPLQIKPFADIFTFSRASAAWDYNAAGVLTEHAPNAIRQGYDPAQRAPRPGGG